ncbi:hypothetical protein Dsin_032867 [Dipteronia sinensis]|uniref:Small auxin up regulated protein n=1 Tax=Dipteronia sinensis TaxID=43782 RepID=A0AAE0DQM3_9ROSI|nr:hypothetical protein Dsin_032867 [Dipteronia sinensis]
MHMATTIKKIITIWQIIRLKQVMKHWKARSLKHKLNLSDSGSADASPSLGHPKHHHHILSGFFAVYVGEDRKRFLIPTRFLNLPIFVYLLKIAEEEYGFKCNGGIALPCEVDLFEEVLKFLVKDEKKYGSLEVSRFLKLIREMEFDSFSCKESPLHQSFMPILLKS